MMCTIVPGFPENSARSALWARDLEPSEQRSLFPALSARSEGRDPASDALCRAPLQSGLRDLTPHRERKYQDRFRSPPRQRRRASLAQNALFATNSIHEHNPG